MSNVVVLWGHVVVITLIFAVMLSLNLSINGSF